MLHWDFTASEELVTRYVSMQALDGFALSDGSEIIGYTYWVSEEHKGLIGDLYVRDAYRTPAHENLLLRALLSHMRRNPWIQRVEAQLMQMCSRGSQVIDDIAPHAAYLRHFMLAPLSGVQSMRAIGTDPIRLEPWTLRWLDSSAELISAVYAGHVDSEINDQYHSAHGAKRFLQNIVQYPGCGHFSPQCSWVAIHDRLGVVGLSLASKVASNVGHIAQLCLAPEFQGRGAGYELLRRSLEAMRNEGAEEVSLTVTASNTHAIRLYEHAGFRSIYTFEALVWPELKP